MNQIYEIGTFVRHINKPGVWVVIRTFPPYSHLLKKIPDANNNYELSGGNYNNLVCIDDPNFNILRTGQIFTCQ
jgi:hypothetical protein